MHTDVNIDELLGVNLAYCMFTYVYCVYVYSCNFCCTFVKNICMNDRLQKLMLSEKLVPAKFAEIIGVQRSSISHILSGRNKPSFDVINSILIKFPKVNPDWLLLGTGEMYRKPIQTSIFDQIKPNEPVKPTEKISHHHDNKLIEDDSYNDIVDSKPIKNPLNEKKVERVLVFYTDKTFIEYFPNK